MQFKGHVPLHSQLCPTSVQSVVGNSSQYFVLFDLNVGTKKGISFLNVLLDTVLCDSRSCDLATADTRNHARLKPN
jgi:hypothetical protein